MQTIALRTTPSATTLFSNQFRVLLIRCKWDILILAGLMFFYQLIALPGLGDTAELFSSSLFIDGALGQPGHFIFMFIVVLWSARTWADLPPGRRASFLSYPVDRMSHHAIRVLAGAVILLLVMAASWLLGAAVCEIAAPGSSYFSQEGYYGWGWLLTLVGLFNVYLFGTILALMFRRPEQWFILLLLGLPMLLFLLFLLGLTRPHFIPIVINLIFGLPYGLFAGFGFALIGSDSGLSVSLPDLPLVLLWSFILASGVLLAANIRREE